MQLKKTFALAMLAIGLTLPTMAQKEYQAYPHGFIGLQGGIQTTLTDYDQSKLLTPTASISGGYWWTSVVATRLHVNGIWNKGGLNPNSEYDYKYVTTDLDVMLNLVNLFGHKDYYPVGLNLIGGIGLNTAWDNGDARALKTSIPFAWSGTRFSHNARVGLQLDVDIIRNLSVNLEVDANSLSDRYNSKVNNHDDWQLTAQLGLAFKFGHKKANKSDKANKVKEEEKPQPVQEAQPTNTAEQTQPEVAPEPEPVYATRIDTVWYDDKEYYDTIRQDSDKWEIFYEMAADSANDAEAKIRNVAKFLQDYKEDTHVTVTSFADKGSGTPAGNMKFSKKRAMKATEILKAEGVDGSIITTDWKGDKVQPYPNPEDNDKNRLTIITAKGQKKVKTYRTVRKFKTKEVKYRVQ